MYHPLDIHTKNAGSSISVTIRGGKKHSGVEMLEPGHIQACLASSVLY